MHVRDKQPIPCRRDIIKSACRSLGKTGVLLSTDLATTNR